MWEESPDEASRADDGRRADVCAVGASDRRGRFLHPLNAALMCLRVCWRSGPRTPTRTELMFVQVVVFLVSPAAVTGTGREGGGGVKGHSTVFIFTAL